MSKNLRIRVYVKIQTQTVYAKTKRLVGSREHIETCQMKLVRNGYLVQFFGNKLKKVCLTSKCQTGLCIQVHIILDNFGNGPTVCSSAPT